MTFFARWLYIFYVLGFVTDGEFLNSLRTKGSQRPLSVIQLMADAKSKAKSIPASRIARYLTPKNKGKINGFCTLYAL